MNKTDKSKELAFLLRHDTHYDWEGSHGWRTVADLVQNHKFKVDELFDIVATDNKNRYELSEDKTLIRARQGHSIPVDVDLQETPPPDFLYHGTAYRFMGDILESGIKKMTRQYVHLSRDYDTAEKVGERHGKPYVITINSKLMREDGIKFYLSSNGVWLTDYVDPKYFE